MEKSFLFSLVIPWFGVLCHLSSLRLSSLHSGPVLTLRTNDVACTSHPALLAGGECESLGYFSAGNCGYACILWVFLFLLLFFFSSLCCPLRFQNSPQIHLWDGFLLGGNFSSFSTCSPGQISVPKSFVSLSLFFFFFVFYILSYLLSKRIGCLSGCLISYTSI